MSYVRPPSALAAKTVRMMLLACCLSAALIARAAAPGRAQDLPVYTDSLTSNFQNWSWATVNLTNTTPVQSGTDSISVTCGPWQALSLHCGTNIDTTGFAALSFWVNGGPTGGQQFTVHALNAGGANLPSVPVTNYIPGGVIPANAWVHVTIPLADLQAANLSDFNAFWLQESTGNAQPVFYVDTISLLGLPAPATVHVSVDATKALQTVNSRDFGVNTAIWDGYLGSSDTVSLVTAAGAGVFRFPGGSASDDLYDWTVQQYGGQSTTPTFGGLIDATGAQAVITTNYGSGSPQMAAAWVAYCNASLSNTAAIGLDPAGRDWKTASYWAALRGATPLGADDGLNFLRVSHPAPYDFHQWEIGNEVYGTWEYDTHAVKNDPVTYAHAAQAMSALMKQVDPTIQVGVVATPSEDDWGYASEAVTNPVTGVQHSGWTPELLATLNSINYVPDFVILHNYPGGGDAVLLQSWSWAGIASGDRAMLTDYMGAAKSASIQLVATENNTGTNGKQATSLVDGLYYAESIGGLIQTEFQGMLWWDLRNGANTSGDNTPNYYGWRLYEDNGMIANGGGLPGSALDTPYPPYFALKLASKFARGGDTVVSAASDFPLLNVFAAKRAGGGLSLMAVNTDPGAALTTQFTIAGYAPAATAATYQYGETQDTLQSTGATVDLAQSSLTGLGATFSTSFPPYSMTVINLTPAPPTITSLTPTSGPAGTVVTITGTNFTGTSAVNFHAALAQAFTVNPAGSQITATVPAGALSGTVRVTTSGGAVTSAQSFTVVSFAPTITSFTPASGLGGTVVTITGTNLSGVTAVRFHDANAKVFSANPAGTQITATVPAGAQNGTIKVTTPYGSVTSAQSFTP